MSDIPIPRNHDYRLGTVRQITEVNRWGTEVDSRLVEILECLGQTAKRVNILTTRSTPPSGGVLVHAPQHYPQTGFDPLLTAAPTGGYGLTGTVGTSDNLLRADARLLYPSALAEYVFNTTFTLTADASTQTLTGSAGDLLIRSGSHGISFDWWTAAGGANLPSVGTVLQFNATTVNTSTALVTGVSGQLNWLTGTYVGQTFRGATFAVTTSAGPSYTSVTARGIDISLGASGNMTGTHTFSERSIIRLGIGNLLGASVTVTDTSGISMSTWQTIGTVAVCTNVRAAQFSYPTVGATIRRGVEVTTQTTNSGAEPTDAEGFYMAAMARGNSRYSFRAVGATTGTPAAAYGFYSDAHTVGTSRWSFWGSNKVHCDASDFIAFTTAKGFITKDAQGTPRYWRMTVDSTGATSADATMAVDLNGILTVTRGGAAAGTVNFKIVDTGLAPPVS